MISRHMEPRSREELPRESHLNLHSKALLSTESRAFACPRRVENRGVPQIQRKNGVSLCQRLILAETLAELWRNPSRTGQRLWEGQHILNKPDSIAKIIAKRTGCELSAVKAESTFAEPGIDSMDTVKHLMNPEDGIGVEIDLDQTVETVGALDKFIQSKAQWKKSDDPIENLRNARHPLPGVSGQHGLDCRRITGRGRFAGWRGEHHCGGQLTC